MMAEMNTMRGKIAKWRLFKIGSGSTRAAGCDRKYRACRVENTNRPAEQIQVSAGNKSTSFWLLDIFAANWGGQFKLSTLYRRTWAVFSVDLNHYEICNFYCIFVYICMRVQIHVDFQILLLYGYMGFWRGFCLSDHYFYARPLKAESCQNILPFLHSLPNYAAPAIDNFCKVARAACKKANERVHWFRLNRA